MSLKDFTPNKIKSFRYPENNLAQSFEANGTIVTGNKKPIGKKYIQGSDPNFSVREKATIFDDNAGSKAGDARTPQQFIVSNPAGTSQITGLMGTFTIDTLRDKSLIMKTFDESLNGKSLNSFFNFRNDNATYGHREVPFIIRDFGKREFDAMPTRFGNESQPSIKFTSSQTRGGIYTSDIVDYQLELMSRTGVLVPFLAKQTLLQNKAIFRGSQLGIEGPFQIFNAMQFGQSFTPGNLAYRHGFNPSALYGDVPTYTNSTPLMKKSGLGALLGFDNLDPYNTTENLNQTPKMLYLYKNFILGNDTGEKSGNGFYNYVRAVWDDSQNPYPIAPTVNTVNSVKLSKNNLAYYEKMGENPETNQKYLDEDATSLVESEGPFNFFSKSASKSYKDSEQNEKDLITRSSERMYPHGIYYKLDVNGTLAGFLRPEITEEATDDLSNIQVSVAPSSVEIKNNPVLSYMALGTSDKNQLVDPGGAASLRYEKTLRSASELNQTIGTDFGGLGEKRTKTLSALSGPSADKISTERTGIRDHMQKKVYAIGKQGDKVGVESVDDIFLGTIKKSDDDKYNYSGTDSVNIIPYGHNEDELSNDALQKAETLDFVPLAFKDVFNDKTIVFRSILGSITDTISPEWNEEQFVGRPVKSATYKGVDRKISFNFKIYPKSKQEFPVLLEKVNYLVGLCYPNLDKFYRQTAPLIKLTLGDILRQQLGYLSGVTVEFPEDSTWELDYGMRFTKLINVSIDFSYIGGYIPISTGKHYGLPWLRGDKMGFGVKFNNYPDRKGTEEVKEIATPGSINRDFRPLFSELGQDK